MTKRQLWAKQYYKDNKERIKTRVTNRQSAAKSKLVQYMGDKCVDCQYTFHDSVYDVHHTDPSRKTLKFHSSQLASHKWEDVVAELEHCDLLCPNCHRIRHITGNLNGN